MTTEEKVNVKLTQEEHEALDKLAKYERRTVAAQAAMVIRDMLISAGILHPSNSAPWDQGEKESAPELVSPVAESQDPVAFDFPEPRLIQGSHGTSGKNQVQP